MDIHPRHDWALTPERAITLQRELAREVIADHPLDLAAVRFVAGVDVSVKPDANGTPISHAAVVVLTFPDLRVVETARHTMPTPFPYIPGLLSFREAPALIEAFRKLRAVPDVFLFDGMGRAHPRRLGIASHLGLWLNAPTIGVGKTLLVGRHGHLPAERGAHALLVDRDEVIGAALRTRATAKPVYVSVGHLCDLPSALALVMACTGRFRLPEPIRAAHQAAGSTEHDS